jgi:Zn-dependent membrane protease YugP
MMTFDWRYILLVLLPGLVLGLWAQARVRSAYGRASQIRSRRGLTGRSTAQAILDAEGIPGVAIEPTSGFLTDHYHPGEKVLRLSEENFEGSSLAAVGVAAHEVGHAIQHARGYAPLTLRSALVPVCTVGSWIGQLALLFGGLLAFTSPVLGRTVLFWGILGYSAVFLFTLVTLPVEFNASSRALRVLAERGILDEDELPEVKSVLGAAGWTYVAASVQVLLVLLYLLDLFHRRD